MEPAKLPEIEMDYDCDVYEPAEDTFLFLDALQDEKKFLQEIDPSICLEIGCSTSYFILVFFLFLFFFD
jgi:release factor glutamine methyltransferase